MIDEKYFLNFGNLVVILCNTALGVNNCIDETAV